VCSRKFIETISEQQQLHKHHEDDRLLPDRKIVCLNENIVKGPLTNVVSYHSRIFSQQESKYTHNYLYGFCFSLIVRFSICRQPDATFSQSKSLSQIKKPHGPLYMLMTSFISSFNDAFSSKFPPICHPMCSLSLQFSNWKYISTDTLTIIQS